RRDGDGWVLDGRKQFITNARYAPVAIVFARVGAPDPRKASAGITAFLVPLAAPGVSVGPAERKLGLRASDTSALILDGAQVDAARLLMLRAAWLRDRGQPFTREAAMAKLYASEMAQRATHAAVQTLGGNGYMREYDVERYARDGRATTIYEGTSEIQRLVI